MSKEHSPSEIELLCAEYRDWLHSKEMTNESLERIAELYKLCAVDNLLETAFRQVETDFFESRRVAKGPIEQMTKEVRMMRLRLGNDTDL
jgi:hypothetical protein